MSKPTVLAAMIAMALLTGACAEDAQTRGTGAGVPTGNDMMKEPMEWCRQGSLEPDRCMGRASFEHEYCVQKSADREHYARCRRAMDS